MIKEIVKKMPKKQITPNYLRNKSKLKLVSENNKSIMKQEKLFINT
jgi:hypothetical protein